MTGIYRVPLKRVYKKKHTESDASWHEIYGSHKCLVCRKHFLEGETYVVVVTWKKHADGSESPIHKFQHTDCAELKDNLPIRKKEKEKAVRRK
jgi:hypothetical protein